MMKEKTAFVIGTVARGLSILILMTLCVPSTGLCEIYKWTNDDGSVGFADDISNVPEKQRQQVETKQYRVSESERKEEPPLRRGSESRGVQEQQPSEKEQAVTQELSDEEKKKLDEELRGTWGKMKKALERQKIK